MTTITYRTIVNRNPVRPTFLLDKNMLRYSIGPIKNIIRIISLQHNIGMNFFVTSSPIGHSNGYSM